MSKFIKVTNYAEKRKWETFINTECISEMHAASSEAEHYYVSVGGLKIKVDAQDAQRIFDIIGISL